MTPASCKAKGRVFQKAVVAALYEKFPELQEGDIESRSMGSQGTDLLLSPAARARFPYSVECKCQESLNVWSALKQAEENAGTLTPLLTFRRNRSTTYVALRFNDFLKLFPGR